MPSSKRIVVKDSHPALLDALGKPPQGRTYSSAYSQLPGGIRINDVTLGLQLACVAITDDKPNTLKKIGRTNPWQVQAMTQILGSPEAAHAPLTEILGSFNLQLDHHLDISGFRAGYALDTQGYIAHNAELIVLAYRCTTSGLDWMTNMSTSTSAWEYEDIEQGHSGRLSCIDGLCCNGGDAKPRVHTGFYNNFLASAPFIQQYIDPLLAPDQPPRKLMVVGHSLGAGIATMATCYFLLQHDWENLPHSMVTVTAGGPRACCTSMKQVVEERLNILRPLGKASICRVVRDKDCVPSVPPKALGFEHLEKLVYLTKDGAVLINPDLSNVISKRTLRRLAEEHASLEGSQESGDQDDDEDEQEEEPQEMSRYDKNVKAIPRAFRDHMPDFYLAPLVALNEKEHPTPEETPTDEASTDGEGDPIIEIKEKHSARKLFGRMFGRNRRQTRRVVNV